MNVLKGILNTREVSYASHLDSDRFIQKAQDLFIKKTSSFKGKFIRKNKFVAYDSLNVIGWDMPYLKRKSAYLKGEISTDENRTLIKIKAKPNAFLPIFAIVAFIAGSIIITLELSNIQNNTVFYFFGIALLSLGLIYYPLSSFFRTRLQNKLVESLELKEV